MLAANADSGAVRDVFCGAEEAGIRGDNLVKISFGHTSAFGLTDLCLRILKLIIKLPRQPFEDGQSKADNHFQAIPRLHCCLSGEFALSHFRIKSVHDAPSLHSCLITSHELLMYAARGAYHVLLPSNPSSHVRFLSGLWRAEAMCCQGKDVPIMGQTYSPLYGEQHPHPRRLVGHTMESLLEYLCTSLVSVPSESIPYPPDAAGNMYPTCLRRHGTYDGHWLQLWAKRVVSAPATMQASGVSVRCMIRISSAPKGNKAQVHTSRNHLTPRYRRRGKLLGGGYPEERRTKHDHAECTLPYAMPFPTLLYCLAWRLSLEWHGGKGRSTVYGFYACQSDSLARKYANAGVKHARFHAYKKFPKRRMHQLSSVHQRAIPRRCTAHPATTCMRQLLRVHPQSKHTCSPTTPGVDLFMLFEKAEAPIEYRPAPPRPCYHHVTLIARERTAASSGLQRGEYWLAANALPYRVVVDHGLCIEFHIIAANQRLHKFPVEACRHDLLTFAAFRATFVETLYRDPCQRLHFG
ncbi:uncharacterized protein MYCFIDRAFT_177966 [Pseudocercospora fijiensis CIRAD86]|uniref:Uncharacterized protein n=1 Tax=Pseudocercospora fijiensis (strain CIRAD86) TaxID=383855 RepID=M3AQK1_PSEFD|nr:uncharacterized protein MYCFIDRAFT_177966 [Pseudocercospora fijiensis CIRAD86]EME79363.1 hypothetical protein MYCFIDRAFT_177966 [Pseudocercospora fijiensis CIRAD86]